MDDQTRSQYLERCGSCRGYVAGYARAVAVVLIGTFLALCMSGCFAGTAGVVALMGSSGGGGGGAPPQTIVERVDRDYGPYTGGTRLTITGKNFLGPVRVVFSGVEPGQEMQTITDGTRTQIVATLPPSRKPATYPTGERQVLMKVINSHNRESPWYFSYDVGVIRIVTPPYGLAEPAGDGDRTVVTLSTSLFRARSLFDLDSGDQGVFLVPQDLANPYGFSLTDPDVVRLAATDLVSFQELPGDPDNERYVFRVPPDPRRSGGGGGSVVYEPYNLVIVSDNGRANVPFAYVPPFPPEGVRVTVQWVPTIFPHLDREPVVIVRWTENADGPPPDPTNVWPADTDLLTGDRYTRVRITRRPHDPTQRPQSFDIPSNGTTAGEFRDTELSDFGVFTYEVVGYWVQPQDEGDPDPPEHPTIAAKVTVLVIPRLPFHMVWDPSLRIRGGLSLKQNGNGETSGEAIARSLRESGQTVVLFPGDDLGEVSGEEKIFTPLDASEQSALAAVWITGGASISEDLFAHDNAHILLDTAQRRGAAPPGSGFGIGFYLETRRYLIPGWINSLPPGSPARELLVRYFGLSDTGAPPQHVKVSEVRGVEPFTKVFTQTQVDEAPAIAEVSVTGAIRGALRNPFSTVARRVLTGLGEDHEGTDQESLMAYVRRLSDGGDVPKNFVVSGLDFARFPEAGAKAGGSRQDFVEGVTKLLTGDWDITLEPQQAVVDPIPDQEGTYEEGGSVTITGTNLELLEKITVWNRTIWESGTPIPDNTSELVVALPPRLTLGEVLVRIYGQGDVIVGEFTFTYRGPRIITVTPGYIPVSPQQEFLTFELTIEGFDLSGVKSLWLTPAGGGERSYLEFDPSSDTLVRAFAGLTPPNVLTVYDLGLGLSGDSVEELTSAGAVTLIPRPEKLTVTPTHGACGEQTKVVVGGTNLWRGAMVYFCIEEGESCYQLEDQRFDPEAGLITGTAPPLPAAGNDDTVYRVTTIETFVDPFSSPRITAGPRFTCIRGINADFEAIPTLGCAPLQVTFSDRSAGTITQWEWDFGDGSPTSTDQNPRHTYQRPGTYTVSLLVRGTVDGVPREDTETKPDFIVIPEPPVADFEALPDSGPAPLTVVFTDLSTGDITEWQWDFGDGGTSEEKNPKHEYVSAGSYTVSLIVIGPCGTSPKPKTAIIDVCAPPVAAFSGTPLSGPAPLEVSFIDSSTGEITDWFWSFGDKETSTEQNPVHVYDGPGTYTVSLQVTDPCATDTETKAQYVTVFEPLIPDFSGTPRSGPAPLTVTFTDLSTGQINNYDWQFGDGGTSDLANPTHTYTKEGDYDVTLEVTGPAGTETELKPAYITVLPPAPPVAAFQGSPRHGTAPLTVSFLDLSTGTVTGWSWDFGDGTTSTAQNPAHRYASTGTYTVTLTASGPGGNDAEEKVEYIIVTNLAAEPLAAVYEKARGSRWFGGDDRARSKPRNLGVGQSIVCPRDCVVYTVGFQFLAPFDYAGNPDGRGHRVTLVLNLRNARGTILARVEKVLPATFAGGWVDFDLSEQLRGGQTYIFTCYLKDGERLEYKSSVAFEPNDVLPDSQGYVGQINVIGGNMEAWSIWKADGSDHNIRIIGAFSDFAGFTFNSGTDQNWTLQGAFKGGTGPFPSNFSFAWATESDVGNPPRQDGLDDAIGSIRCSTDGGHGIPAGGEWWIMQYHSPDLSPANAWQATDGYAVRIADTMGLKTRLYANLFVWVYDRNPAEGEPRDRFFYNGDAQPLDLYEWNFFSFDWSTIGSFPTDYVVRGIHVNLWGLMSATASELQGSVYVDQVMPLEDLVK